MFEEMEDEYEGIEEDEESEVKFKGLNDGEMTIELSEHQVIGLYSLLRQREFIRDRLSIVVDADSRTVKRLTLTPIPPKPLSSRTLYFQDNGELQWKGD